MKHTVFLRILLPSPEWEAFRRVKQNAKTNNKASQIRGAFIDNKRQHYDIGKPVTGAARKSARWMKIISITGRATRTGRRGGKSQTAFASPGT